MDFDTEMHIRKSAYLDAIRGGLGMRAAEALVERRLREAKYGDVIDSTAVLVRLGDGDARKD